MNLFNKLDKPISSLFKIYRYGKTSNASRNITKLTFFFALQYKFKALLLNKSWRCGRSNTGRITVFTKGPMLKRGLPFVNYSCRRQSLFFIAGVNYAHFKSKISSLTFNSAGEVQYLPSKMGDKLFLIHKYKPILKKISPNVISDVLTIKPYILLTQTPYMLIQQLKNKSISFLEL